MNRKLDHEQIIAFQKKKKKQFVSWYKKNKYANSFKIYSYIKFTLKIFLSTSKSSLKNLVVKTSKNGAPNMYHSGNLIQSMSKQFK